MKHLHVLLIIGLLSSCAAREHAHVNASSERAVKSIGLNPILDLEPHQYIKVNQKVYEVTTTLDQLLNEVFSSFSHETVQVDLNTAEYDVESTIFLPSDWQSRIIINGNHATINSSVPEGDFVFFKAADLKKGLTGSADTYQDIRNMTIKGTGGAIHYRGGYQSKVINVRTSGLSRGFLMEFILQGKIEDCHIVSPSDYGIKIQTIPGTNVNHSQCNEFSVINSRIFAKNTDIGIYIANSNLVKLEGNIIEGGQINKAVYFHNVATTVVSFLMKRTHFECSKFVEAAFYIDGFVSECIVDEMYYSGKYGYAIQSQIKRQSDLVIKNTFLNSWGKCLKTEDPMDFGNGWYCKTTYWRIYTTDVKKIEFLFDKKKPFYAYLNGSRRVLK